MFDLASRRRGFPQGLSTRHW